MENNRLIKAVIFLDFSGTDTSDPGALMLRCITLLSNRRFASVKGLNWIFPPGRIFENNPLSAETAEALKTRLDQDDTLIASGYAGAHHSLLLHHELEKEYSWAAANPFDSGLWDKFSSKPEFIFTAEPDLNRKAFYSFYCKTGSKTLFIHPESRNQLLSLIDGENLLYFPLIHINRSAAAGKNILSPVLRKKAKTSHLYYLLQIKSLRDVELFSALLEQYNKINKKKEFIQTAAFSGEAVLMHVSYEKLQEYKTRGMALSPLKRLSVQNLANIKQDGRRKTPDSARIRTALMSKSFNSVSPDKSLIKSLMTEERILVANMTGEILLPGEEFTVLFKNGRISGLFSDSFNFSIKTFSFIEAEKKCWHFSKVSAFSFETDNTRGLRECMAIEAPFIIRKGELTIDYFFIDDIPDLIMNINIRYPVFRTGTEVKSFAPLEIIFEDCWNRTEKIHAAYPDSEESKVNLKNIRGQHSCFDLAGIFFNFIFRGQPLSVSFLSNSGLIETLPVKVNGKDLHINIRGSYKALNAEELNGFEEEFTTVLSFTPASITGTESFDKRIFKEIAAAFTRPMQAD